MIYGVYLLVVVIDVNRRSVQLPVLPPNLVTFAGKSEKGGRGRRKKDDFLAEYGNDWRPVVVDLKGFNINTVSTNPRDIILHHGLRFDCIQQLHTLVVIPSTGERMLTSSYLVAFEHR
jgi:hypothetical protein